MKLRENFAEWLYLIGTVLITGTLIDLVGICRAISLGLGISLTVGSIIRLIKQLNKK